MNRFTGLDLVNSVPEELWAEEAVNKTILKKKKNKEAMWLSEEVL